MRQVDIALGLYTSQEQIHQRIVRQVQQAGQRIDLVIRHLLLVRIQEARQDQVILEKTAARAPAQAGTVGRIGLMRFHH